MSQVKIVTDSSVTIEPEVVEKYGITIVPLSVMVDGVLYSDAELTEGEFLQLMKSSKNLPKTSQPPVGVFAEIFEGLAEEGAQIIAIHMSHALSGTVEAARQGATLANADVTVIDSSFTDQAMKFQVVEAAKLAQEGASVEEIVARIEEVKQNSRLYIGVSTLENLVKGGRIGRVTGLLSSLLNIRVVMEMKNDELQPIVKGRGQKTFKKWLDELMQDLSGKEIARHIGEEIVIMPFNPKRLNPNSYNLTLADELMVYDNYELDMKKKNTGHLLKIPQEGYVLEPNKLYLGRTHEYTKTTCFVPMLEGRSSVGRLGLFIHVTAGFGDVGFSGYWTLEMFCVQPIRIYSGVEICQIYFHTVLGEAEKYISGKYQNNQGIQPSLLYKDFEK